MITPHDIPGYTQGWRFSDDANYYDGAGSFYDLSPYAAWGNQDCTLTSGAPVFETVAGHRALRLDNSSHWNFTPSASWEGAMLIVLKPTDIATGTVTRTLLLMGGHPNALLNPGLSLVHVSNNRRLSFNSSSSTVSAQSVRSDDQMRVFMGASSQETRKFYAAEGSAITETAAISGNPIAGVGSFESTGGSTDLHKSRLGSIMAGDDANLTPTVDLYAHLYEIHLWNTPVLKDYTAHSLALIAAKRQEYGL